MLADSPSEWSKCTGKLPAYWSRLRWKKFLIGSDVQPNDFFFFVTVQTEKQTWLFLRVRADTHSGVCRLLLRSKGKFHPRGAKVPHLSCYSKPPVCEVLNISLNIIQLSSLSDINNNKVAAPTSPLKYHAVLYSDTFVKDQHWSTLDPRGESRD